MRIIVQFYTDKLSHKVSHDGWFYTPKWYYIKTISGWLVVSMPSHHAPVSILRFVRYVLINIISHSIPFKTPVQHIIYIYMWYEYQKMCKRSQHLYCSTADMSCFSTTTTTKNNNNNTVTVTVTVILYIYILCIYQVPTFTYSNKQILLQICCLLHTCCIVYYS